MFSLSDKFSKQRSVFFSLGLVSVLTLFLLGYVLTQRLQAMSPRNLAMTLEPEAKGEWSSFFSCNLPCWQGIVPGQTSAKDAIQLLKANPLFENLRKGEGKFFEGAIYWNWVGSNGQGSIFYNPADSKEVVYAIRPGFQTCVSLGWIVAFYGEPSHIWLGKTTPIDMGAVLAEPIYSYNLIWIKSGLAFNSIRPGTSIDEKFELCGPNIFANSMQGYLEYASQSQVDLLQEWKGYGNFDKYLRESNQPSSEVTP